MRAATHNAACAHAIAEYPKESCGLVVTVKRKEFYVPCRNIAEKPEDDFILDPHDYMKAEDMGNVKALVHSHPDQSCVPTMADKVYCESSGLAWRILAVASDPLVEDGAVKIIGYHDMKPNGYEAPYRGREFIFGIMDCYTLVQDFYKRDMGVVLPDFDRQDKFWEQGQDLYMDNFQAAGFREIAAPSEKGDLILMNIRSDIVNHAGIWLAEMDHMLHHPYEHLSERTVYGGYWREVTRLYIRKVE
jgi:proteasome lid subunit RPN8/RPN11